MSLRILSVRFIFTVLKLFVVAELMAVDATQLVELAFVTYITNSDASNSGEDFRTHSMEFLLHIIAYIKQVNIKKHKRG